MTAALLGAAAAGLALTMAATAQGAPTFSATASVAAPPQYLDDTTGTVFTFTVVNTGTTAIGAVEIQRPSLDWTIVGCPAMPPSWKAQVADTKCRFRADRKGPSFLEQGESAQFAVQATTRSGDRDRTGTWPVSVSRSTNFDAPSALVPVPPTNLGALTTTAHAFQVLDAGVADGPAAPGSDCPALTREALTGSTQDVVVCGRNRTTGPQAPAAAHSSLAGTWIAAPGTFSSGPVAPTTTSRVLGTWTGAQITGSSGPGKTVVAVIGASTEHTSPQTTLTGYEALNEPPTAVDDAASTSEDESVTVDVLANDSDPDGDSFTLTDFDAEPAGGGVVTRVGDDLVFDPDGDFEDLTPGASRQSAFTYTITDVRGATGTATVAVTVTGVNDAPVAADDAATVGEDSTGELVDVLANDTDVDNAAPVVSAVDTTDTVGAVTNNGGNVSYSPNGMFEHLGPGETAQDTFTYTVSDGSASDTATVTITITGVNDAPVAVDDVGTTDEDSPTVLAVLANDSDAEGPVSITALHTTGISGIAVDNGDGTIGYAPAGGFESLGAGQSGTDTFSYTITDSDGVTDSATVTVTVTGVDDAPVAADDAATVGEDSTGQFVDVLANDTDAEGQALVVSAVDTTVTVGVVTNNGDDVSYDPNGAFDGLSAGETAQDTFTYTVSDGTSTDTATVTVTITGANDPPLAVDDAYSTDADTALVVPAPGVLTNDSDPDVGDSLAARNATDPVNGAVALSPDGSFTYTPDAGFSGIDSFSYDADDGSATDSATVTITVVPPNAAPTAAATSASGNEDGGPITVTLSGADADGDALTFTAGTAEHGLVTVPGAVTCTGATPNECTSAVSYTPTADYHGPDSFTYTVNDGTVDSAPATVTLTIAPVNDAPSFTKGADSTVLEDAAAQSVSNWASEISAGPANESGQTVSFTVTTDNDDLFASLPQVDGAGRLTYTPAPDANGSATVTVLAVDDGGTANGGVDTSPPQTFTITVTPVNDAPSFTPGADQTLAEDAGAQSVAGWATAISTGSANESEQTLTFQLTNDNGGLFSAAPAVSPTGTLSFTPAANAYGVAILTVQLVDNGGTANGGDDSSETASFTISVSAVNDPPVATAKAFAVQTNMKISLAGLLTGATDTADTSQEPSYSPAFQLASVTAGSGCVGCVVSNVDPAGSFDLEPPPGQTGSFTLSYTILDSGFPAPGATSAPASITLTVSGPVIWFVDGTAGDDTTGAGTLATPFKTLGKAATVDAANSRTFLHQGTYADGITLPNGAWLVGAGAKATSFDALMGISPPAGTIARPAVNATPPTVQSTVTLGSGNTLRGLALTGAPALTGSSFGTLTLGAGPTADLTLTSSGQALSLTTGTVSGDLLSTSSSGGPNNVLLSAVSSPGTSLGSGALSGATAEGLRVVGGAGTFSYAGTVAGAGGPTVSIANRTGGAITLTGSVSDTAGPGVQLTNNGGSAMHFTGGVTLSSGVSPAFVATGGGTVTVTGAANTLSSTTGTALHVAGTTIGGPGLTFRSISSNGAARGILLDGTGSSGSLTVTGNGGTCTAADTTGCSGGTIANSTGSDDSSATPVGTGIVLNNTRGVSLTRMRIHDSSNYGIRGTSVTGLSLTSSVVNGVNGGTTAASAGGPFYEGSMLFDNLTGTVAFDAVAVSGGHSSNIEINNTAGTLNATFTGLRVGANSTTQGNDGLQVEGGGTSTVNVTVQNSTFTSSRGDLVQYIADGSGGGSLTFSGNTLTNNHPGIATGGGGVTLNAGAAGPVTMTISSNTLRDAVGNAWTIVKTPGSGSLTGTFNGNTIGNPAVANSGSREGSGMSLLQAGSGSMSWTLTNNAIHQYNNYGINLQAGAGAVAGGVLNAAISGNTISNPGSNDAISNFFQGIHVNSGTSPGDSFTTCVDFGPNSVLGSGRNGGDDVRVRQRQSTTVRLPGYAGGATDTDAVVSFVRSKIGNPSVSVSAAASGTGGGFVGTAC